MRRLGFWLGLGVGGALGLATSLAAQGLFGEQVLQAWTVKYKGAIVCMDPTVYPESREIDCGRK